jgi:hypothetical protein
MADRRSRRLLLLICFVVPGCTATPSSGSAQSATQTATPSATSSQVPAPATKLEAFRPSAGSVVTFGYNNLGNVGGVAVDAREFKDTRGTAIRGVVVEVSQSEYREERAFIDTDELPELLKGIDALLAVKANPTTYQNFEVQYTTKGELQITAFNESSGHIGYTVRAGRITTAQAFLDDEGIKKLRAMFETARQQLQGGGPLHVTPDLKPAR